MKDNNKVNRIINILKVFKTTNNLLKLKLYLKRVKFKGVQRKDIQRTTIN